MSLQTVAWDDFRNARRSYVVLGVVGILTGLVALVFLSETDIYPDPYRALFDAIAFVAFVGPLFVAPLTYLSIAGDRKSGVIKHVLGLPNRRADYFFGKFFSRASVAVAAVLTSTAVAFLIAAGAFTNFPSVVRFAAFAGLTALYLVAFTAIFVAISASTASRSQAMFGALALYFLFVPFWFGFMPVINLRTVVTAVTDVLGTSLSDQTVRRIATISPATAYLESTQLVFDGVLTEYDSFRQYTENDQLAGATWFNVVAMLGWTAVALVGGYVQFRRSQLG